MLNWVGVDRSTPHGAPHTQHKRVASFVRHPSGHGCLCAVSIYAPACMLRAHAYNSCVAANGIRFAEQMLEGKVEEGSAVDKQNYK